jgi:hypothetical protein
MHPTVMDERKAGDLGVSEADGRIRHGGLAISSYTRRLAILEVFPRGNTVKAAILASTGKRNWAAIDFEDRVTDCFLIPKE